MAKFNLQGPHDDLQKELAQLRKENKILCEERDSLKKAAAFFASQSDEVQVPQCAEGQEQNGPPV